jgi:aminopeptidase N
MIGNRESMILRTGAWILLFTIFGRADVYVRQPSIDVLHYDIAVELRDDSDSIAGAARIQILIRNGAARGMWFDLADMDVDKLRVNGIERPFVYQNERLSFDFDRIHSKNERVAIEVQYHGKPDFEAMIIRKNPYGRRVVFTDNWPDRAHHWFPSIDHPSDKATADISVTAPDKYDVVSVGRLVKTESLLDGRKRTGWSESKDIPTYCMVLGIAEFSIQRQADLDGVPLVWYSYPQDAEAAARMFRQTAEALRYFGAVIGPYPYEKLAQVQSTIPLGGMENASAIFYSESVIKMTPGAEHLVPHEIAHQWFGDSITEADWDHLWLSEGFATYFDALFYEHLQGTEVLKQIMADCAKKLAEYAPARTNPIIDPREHDLLKKLNPLNYEKGAWVLHMLRGLIGNDAFYKGIRQYYQLYAGGTVRSEDFQKAMESTSGVSLDSFFHQWLYQPGWPQYSVSWNWNERAHEMECMVRQLQSTGLFDMPLDIVFNTDNGQEVRRLRIAKAEQEFRIPLPGKPLAIEIDPNGWILKSVSIQSEQRANP